ncbi:MAG: hypothetical protein WDZ76_06125 [Pseudohongiellaceae bacterium]
MKLQPTWWLKLAIGSLTLLLLLIGTIAFLMYPAFRSPPLADFPAPASRLEANRQDIAYLRDVLPRLDRSFTPAQWALFHQDLDALREAAGTLDAAALEMGLAKAVARADNGHTNVMGAGWGLTLNSLPLRFYWFADGLYILRADPAYPELPGARVLALNGRAPDELVHLLSPYTGGGPALKRELAVHFMESPQAMQAAGLAESALLSELTLRTSSGDDRVVTVNAIDAPASGPAPARTPLTIMVDPRDLYWPRRDLSPVPLPEEAPFPHPTGEQRPWLHLLDNRSIPISLQHPHRFYWMTGLDDGKILFLQMNAAMDDPSDEPFAVFVNRVLAHVEKEAPRYAIVDFRSNLGGSYQLTAEFTRALPRAMPENGRIFILTSANTYSAGVITTARLKYFSGDRATIVGEPLGDHARFWSEAATRIVLPNSGLRIGYATGFHDWANGCTLRQILICYPANYLLGVAAGDLDPTLPISWSFTDYLAGRDTAVEAVRDQIQRDQDDL